MLIFKTYWQVVLKNMLFTIILYTGIFITISVLFMTIPMDTSAEEVFKLSTTNVHVVDNDHSELSENLTSYVYKNTQKFDLADDENALMDAFFYSQIDLYVEIPKGFSDSLLSESPLTLTSQARPDSSSATMVTTLIEGYLTNAKIYLSAGESDFSKINESLKSDATIKVKNNNTANTMTPINAFYNYMAYTLCATILFAILYVMMIYNNRDLSNRNQCSPVKSFKYNAIIFAGNATLILGILLVNTLVGVFLYGSQVFEPAGLLMMLNSLVFTIVILCLGFFVGNFVNKKAADALVNVISLAFAFLGGVFVSQEIIGDGIARQIGMFLPTFWYVRANDSIAGLENFTFENLTTYFESMAILIGFGLFFASLSLITGKVKEKKLI